jgi:hypothetical protein
VTKSECFPPNRIPHNTGKSPGSCGFRNVNDATRGTNRHHRPVK